MRRLTASLSGFSLVLCVGSSSIFAQTENPNPPKVPAAAVNPVQSEINEQGDAAKPSDSTTAIDLNDTKQTDTKAGTAVAGSAETTKSKTVEPQKTVDPKAKVQQPKQATAVKDNPGRFALTFDDLKFEKEKDEAFDRKLLTSEINSYHGGKVKIRGYIRPNFKQSGITKFIFVRDNKECCFGPQAEIFDNILVRLNKGESTDFTVRPITVEGDFVLKEYYGQDGEVWSLYRLYNAEVK